MFPFDFLLLCPVHREILKIFLRVKFPDNSFKAFFKKFKADCQNRTCSEIKPKKAVAWQEILG